MKPTFKEYDPEVREYLLSEYIGFQGLAHVMKSKKACLIGSLHNWLILTTEDHKEYFLRGKRAFQWK